MDSWQKLTHDDRRAAIDGLMDDVRMLEADGHPDCEKHAKRLRALAEHLNHEAIPRAGAEPDDPNESPRGDRRGTRTTFVGEATRDRVWRARLGKWVAEAATLPEALRALADRVASAKKGSTT